MVIHFLTEKGKLVAEKEITVSISGLDISICILNIAIFFDISLKME